MVGTYHANKAEDPVRGRKFLIVVTLLSSGACCGRSNSRLAASVAAFWDLEIFYRARLGLE